MDGRPTHRRALLLVLCLCFFSIALDNAKLVAAAPVLARQIEAAALPGAALDPNRAVTWILEAGLLVYASLLLLGGAVCERHGPRRTLLVGLSLFAGGSTLAAFCDPRSTLMWARAVVGTGGALMTPATLAAIRHWFTGHERSRAVAWWTASYGLGAAAGPLLGGLLLETWGFASIMLVNVPPALGAIVGARLLLPERSPRHRAPRRRLIDLALLRRPRFALTLLLILLGYFAFSGVSFVTAQYWQVARSYRPVHGGLLTVPLTTSMLAGTLLAPGVARRAGAEGALVSSSIVATAGAALLAWASAHSNDLLFALLEVPFGAGFGSAFANATEVVLDSAPAERAGSAAGASETAFELGGAIGVAVLSAALTRSVGWALATGTAAALLSTGVAFGIAWLARESRQRAAHGVRLGEERRPDENVSLGGAGRGENRGAESGACDPT